MAPQYVERRGSPVNKSQTDRRSEGICRYGIQFPSECLVALAYLGLARAHVLQGDTSKAKAAYQDFLALWKNADPEIPILKEARTEYAKLQ